MDETISTSIAGLVSSGTVTSRERKALATIGVRWKEGCVAMERPGQRLSKNELAKLSPARRSAAHALGNNFSGDPFLLPCLIFHDGVEVLLHRENRNLK